MGLKDQIAADMKDAMRAGQRERLGALRLLRAAIQNTEIARTDPKHADHGKPVTETDVLAVVQKEIKQRHDSIDQFARAGRDDLVAKEQGEVEVLESYLPKQLTRDEIALRVNEIIERIGSDFRQVMPVAAREMKGLADGRIVNEVVRERTST